MNHGISLTNHHVVEAPPPDPSRSRSERGKEGVVAAPVELVAAPVEEGMVAAMVEEEGRWCRRKRGGGGDRRWTGGNGVGGREERGRRID